MLQKKRKVGQKQRKTREKSWNLGSDMREKEIKKDWELDRDRAAHIGVKMGYSLLITHLDVVVTWGGWWFVIVVVAVGPTIVVPTTLIARTPVATTTCACNATLSFRIAVTCSQFVANFFVGQKNPQSSKMVWFEETMIWRKGSFWTCWVETSWIGEDEERGEWVAAAAIGWRVTKYLQSGLDGQSFTATMSFTICNI